MAQIQKTVHDHARLTQLLRAEDAQPDHVALRFGTETLTYGALREQAKTVAAALCTHSGDDLHVGLAMERGPNAFVAMLAVLLAGGKCVPVDTSYPESYKQNVFETAGCTLVLTDVVTEADRKRLGCPTLAFDALLQTPPAPIDQALDADPGFILFTSGTTGTPKGVVLPLTALIAATQSFAERTDLDEHSIVAQYAGLSFDAAVLEFLVAFVHRVPLAIMSAAARIEPETLAAELADTGVTHLILPAAVAPYLPLRADYALRAFICVGDVLEERVFHDWAAVYPTYNGYGPSEGAVCTSLHRVTPGQPVTLGSPLDHLQIRIGGIDGQELLLGGAGIATGYINNPTQTNERFKPDAEGQIWYHTGDRVVRDAETGALSFAGRFDFQTKINGVRVELLALEAALTSLRWVDDAVVLACPGADGQKFLAAFVASSKEGADLEAAARRAIAERLPAGHMPSVFRIVPRLPLTTNQKVDRAALQASLQQQGATGTGDPARAVFLAELRKAACDEEANFFHEGGNSIGAMRLLAALEAQTGKHVSVKDFRRSPTIAGLRNLLKIDRPISLEVARNQRKSDELHLSAQQKTAWYMHQQDPQSKAYLAEAVHYFHGPLDVEALGQALQDLFDAHEIYRTTFHDRAGVPVQKIHMAHEVDFVRIDATGTPDQDRDAVLQGVIDQQLPGIPDLTQLPLANFALVTFGEADHAFVHQEHHIVHDGWGGSAFTAELLNRYHKHVDCTFDYKVPNPAQYSDFLLTQDDWLNSSAAQAQIEYWRAQLAGAPQSVALFGKASKAPGFAGGHARLDFSRAEWTACEETCARLGITPFGFTTAVLNLVMWQYSGQTDVVVGAPFANRNWRNAPDILGMLVNTIVLRQKIEQNVTLDDFARATQHIVDEAYAHQEVPFGTLVEALNPERLNGQNPLFNVLLGFHDAPIPVAEVEGFSWRKDETVISNTSKFDLDCLVVNRDSHFTDDDRVSFLWEYRSDVYDAQEINDFVASFRHVFLQLCRDGSTSVGALSVLTPDQDCRINTWETGPEPKSAHIFSNQDFATALLQQLPKFADRVALQTSDEHLTYGALDCRSSALAAALAEQVAPNAKVAIFATRSLAQITAMIAVIKL
ncbi:MAG: AMP-binding protein, partial [Rhodobacteraceae bacterium]|nr:AMP-binding protein [Paracoccaceae bacterium]